MIEISGDKLIIVDVQKEYEQYISFLNEFLFALNEFEGDVLYLFNDEELGFVSEEDQKRWLTDKAVDLGLCDDYNNDDDDQADHDCNEWFNRLSRIRFVGKTYGFLRDVIDEGYVDDAIKLTKYLLDNDIMDCRDIPINKIKRLNIDNDLKKKLLNHDLMLYLPSFDYDILKIYNNATIVGGGREECLLEIEILMRAMNLSYKPFSTFIY